MQTSAESRPVRLRLLEGRRERILAELYQVDRQIAETQEQMVQIEERRTIVARAQLKAA